MAELLPQPKGNEDQILALMAALGQHLIPDYLKNRDVQIPMTPEGMLAPNPAGKVPQLNPSALETGTMAGLDLASMMVPVGGAIKPFVAAAGAGAASKPGLSGLLKQLAASAKKALPTAENAKSEMEASLENIMKALKPEELKSRGDYVTTVYPRDPHQGELQAQINTAQKKFQKAVWQPTKPLLTEAADIGFSPTPAGSFQAVVNGSPAGKVYPSASGKFHASLDSSTGPKSLGSFASQQEAQEAIKAQLIGKPWPYKSAEPVSLTQVPHGMKFTPSAYQNDYFLHEGDQLIGSITSFKNKGQLNYTIDNHNLPVGHAQGQSFSSLDEAKAALLESIASAGKKPSLSDADIAASLAENPGASIFDVAGVKQPGAVADAKAEIVAAMAERTFKDIPITPFDWVSALGTKHAADVMLGKSPEELAALGFNPNLPLFKGGKAFYKKELPDPAAKPYERALFLADTPNVAQHYGDVLPFMARAQKAGEVDWKKVSGGHLHYDEPTMSAIIEAGRAQGFDLLKIKQLLDMGGKQDQYAVLHPNLLRAPHAAFDPTKLHLNNVLAGLAGAAAVPPLLKETDLMNGLGWNQ